MNSVNLENALISVDIVDLLQDYCAIQLDIDSTKVKAAAHVAQTIDITRVIGATNLERIKNPLDSVDDAMRELAIPAWCYYTYSRCLKMFNGTLTDSGYVISEDAERALDVVGKASNEAYSIAEVYMQLLVEALDGETPTESDDIDQGLFTPQIRVFGGEENRGSN
tara:strand:+ start:476 stop:973 length:498 start_codon:yes stop_codon:yes gene_type:complete